MGNEITPAGNTGKLNNQVSTPPKGKSKTKKPIDAQTTVPATRYAPFDPSAIKRYPILDIYASLPILNHISKTPIKEEKVSFLFNIDGKGETNIIDALLKCSQKDKLKKIKILLMTLGLVDDKNNSRDQLIKISKAFGLIETRALGLTEQSIKVFFMEIEAFLGEEIDLSILTPTAFIKLHDQLWTKHLSSVKASSLLNLDVIRKNVETVTGPDGEDLGILIKTNNHPIKSVVYTMEQMVDGLSQALIGNNKAMFMKLFRGLLTHYKIKSGDLRGLYYWALTKNKKPYDESTASDNLLGLVKVLNRALTHNFGKFLNATDKKVISSHLIDLEKKMIMGTRIHGMINSYETQSPIENIDFNDQSKWTDIKERITEGWRATTSKQNEVVILKDNQKIKTNDIGNKSIHLIDHVGMDVSDLTNTHYWDISAIRYLEKSSNLSDYDKSVFKKLREDFYDLQDLRLKQYTSDNRFNRMIVRQGGNELVPRTTGTGAYNEYEKKDAVFIAEDIMEDLGSLISIKFTELSEEKQISLRRKLATAIALQKAYSLPDVSKYADNFNKLVLLPLKHAIYTLSKYMKISKPSFGSIKTADFSKIFNLKVAKAKEDPIYVIGIKSQIIEFFRRCTDLFSDENVKPIIEEKGILDRAVEAPGKLWDGAVEWWEKPLFPSDIVSRGDTIWATKHYDKWERREELYLSFGETSKGITRRESRIYKDYMPWLKYAFDGGDYSAVKKIGVDIINRSSTVDFTYRGQGKLINLDQTVYMIDQVLRQEDYSIKDRIKYFKEEGYERKTLTESIVNLVSLKDSKANILSAIQVYCGNNSYPYNNSLGIELSKVVELFIKESKDSTMDLTKLRSMIREVVTDRKHVNPFILLKLVELYSIDQKPQKMLNSLYELSRVTNLNKTLFEDTNLRTFESGIDRRVMEQYRDDEYLNHVISRAFSKVINYLRVNSYYKQALEVCTLLQNKAVLSSTKQFPYGSLLEAGIIADKASRINNLQLLKQAINKSKKAFSKEFSGGSPLRRSFVTTGAFEMYMGLKIKEMELEGASELPKEYQGLEMDKLFSPWGDGPFSTDAHNVFASAVSHKKPIMLNKQYELFDKKIGALSVTCKKDPTKYIDVLEEINKVGKDIAVKQVIPKNVFDSILGIEKKHSTNIWKEMESLEIINSSGELIMDISKAKTLLKTHLEKFLANILKNKEEIPRVIEDIIEALNHGPKFVEVASVAKMALIDLPVKKIMNLMKLAEQINKGDIDPKDERVIAILERIESDLHIPSNNSKSPEQRAVELAFTIKRNIKKQTMLRYFSEILDWNKKDFHSIRNLFDSDKKDMFNVMRFLSELNLWSQAILLEDPSKLADLKGDFSEEIQTRRGRTRLSQAIALSESEEIRDSRQISYNTGMHIYAAKLYRWQTEHPLTYWKVRSERSAIAREKQQSYIKLFLEASQLNHIVRAALNILNINDTREGVNARLGKYKLININESKSVEQLETAISELKGYFKSQYLELYQRCSIGINEDLSFSRLSISNKALLIDLAEECIEISQDSISDKELKDWIVFFIKSGISAVYENNEVEGIDHKRLINMSHITEILLKKISGKPVEGFDMYDFVKKVREVASEDIFTYCIDNSIGVRMGNYGDFKPKYSIKSKHNQDKIGITNEQVKKLIKEGIFDKYGRVLITDTSKIKEPITDKQKKDIVEMGNKYRNQVADMKRKFEHLKRTNKNSDDYLIASYFIYFLDGKINESNSNNER